MCSTTHILDIALCCIAARTDDDDGNVLHNSRWRAEPLMDKSWTNTELQKRLRPMAEGGDKDFLSGQRTWLEQRQFTYNAVAALPPQSPLARAIEREFAAILPPWATWGDADTDAGSDARTSNGGGELHGERGGEEGAGAPRPHAGGAAGGGGPQPRAHNGASSSSHGQAGGGRPALIQAWRAANGTKHVAARAAPQLSTDATQPAYRYRTAGDGEPLVCGPYTLVFGADGAIVSMTDSVADNSDNSDANGSRQWATAAHPLFRVWYQGIDHADVKR